MGSNNIGLIMRPLEASQRSDQQSAPVAPSTHSNPMGANLNADLNLSSGSELVTSSIPFTTETSVSERNNDNNNLDQQPFAHRILTPESSSLDHDDEAQSSAQ